MNTGTDFTNKSHQLLTELREKIGQISRQEIGLEDELRSARNLAHSSLARAREMVRAIRHISENGDFAQELVSHLESSLASVIATTSSSLKTLQQELHRLIETESLLQTAQDVTQQIRDWFQAMAITISDLKTEYEIIRAYVKNGELEVSIRTDQVNARCSLGEELSKVVDFTHQNLLKLLLGVEMLKDNLLHHVPDGLMNSVDSLKKGDESCDSPLDSILTDHYEGQNSEQVLTTT